MTGILGPASATAGQLASWAATHNPTPVSPWPDWATIADLYIEEGAAEGVDGACAFCQMAHETGYLTFRGDVSADQFNPAGLGATGGGAHGASFPDPRTGVRAQIQHLKAYASTVPPVNPIVDPRFHVMQPHGQHPTWESLDGRWAVPGVGYGEGIVAARDEAAHQGGTPVPAPSGPAPLQVDSDGKLVSPDGHFAITYNDPFPTGNGSWDFQEPAFGVVEHTEVGYEHSVIDEFNSPSAQASSFFSTSGGFGNLPDGAIHQYGPIGKGWKAWTQSQGNPNWRGVENEDGGDPNHPLTAAQVEAMGALLEVCSQIDGFPLQITDDPGAGRGLIIHQDGGQAWGGHACPGDVRAAQRPDILAAAQQFRARRTGQPAPPPVQTTVTTGPSTGDTVTPHAVSKCKTDAQGNGYAQLPGVDAATIVSVAFNGVVPQSVGRYVPPGLWDKDDVSTPAGKVAQVNIYGHTVHDGTIDFTVFTTP